MYIVTTHMQELNNLWLAPGVLKMGCDAEVSRLVNSCEKGQRAARWEHLKTPFPSSFPPAPPGGGPSCKPRALGFTLTYLLQKTEFGKITFLLWSSVPFCVNSASSLSSPAVRSTRATLVKTLAHAFPLFSWAHRIHLQQLFQCPCLLILSSDISKSVLIDVLPG